MNPDSEKEIKKIIEGVIDKIVEEESQEDINKHLSVDVLLNKSLRLINLDEFESSPSSNTERIGTRSQKNITHTELIPTKRVKKVKTMAESKPQLFTFTKALDMVPMYTGDTEVRPWIDACELIMSRVEKTEMEFFAKMVARTKLQNRAYNVVRYREATNWDNIKKMLLDAFETPYAAANLQVELSLIKMGRNEQVNEYNTRVESIFQKLCTSITAGKTEEAALVIKETIRGQALVSYINGLKEELKTEVKIARPVTIEQAMQEAILAEKNIYNDQRVRQMTIGEGQYKINSNYGNNRVNNESNGNRNNNYNNRNNFGRGNSGYNNNSNRNNNLGNQIKCFNCNKNGHVSAQCRSPRNIINYTQPNRATNNFTRPATGYNNQNNNFKICGYCGKMGHTILECYRKIGDEMRINGNNNYNSNNNNINNSGNATGLNANQGARAIHFVTPSSNQDDATTYSPQ